MHVAAKNGQIDFVELLLKHSAHIGSSNNVMWGEESRMAFGLFGMFYVETMRMLELEVIPQTFIYTCFVAILCLSTFSAAGWQDRS